MGDELSNDSPTKANDFGFCACKTLTSQSKPPEDWSSINLPWEIAEMDDEFEMNGLPAKRDGQRTNQERERKNSYAHT